MYDVSIPMALVDYIPVALFGWAAVLLQRDLYRRMPKYAIALFVLSFVCSMGMGYLSGRDSTSAAVNWAEQGVNCLSQGFCWRACCACTGRV